MTEQTPEEIITQTLDDTSLLSGARRADLIMRNLHAAGFTVIDELSAHELHTDRDRSCSFCEAEAAAYGQLEES